MNDYEKMYSLLFNKITDTITQLQQVQQLAEEIYISQKDINPKIIMIKCKENLDENK